jgi:hypothetical protein
LAPRGGSNRRSRTACHPRRSTIRIFPQEALVEAHHGHILNIGEAANSGCIGIQSKTTFTFRDRSASTAPGARMLYAKSRIEGGILPGHRCLQNIKAIPASKLDRGQSRRAKSRSRSLRIFKAWDVRRGLDRAGVVCLAIAALDKRTQLESAIRPRLLRSTHLVRKCPINACDRALHTGNTHGERLISWRFRYCEVVS